MSPMIRKRGRPSGTSDTVIGVPAKKKALSKSNLTS